MLFSLPRRSCVRVRITGVDVFCLRRPRQQRSGGAQDSRQARWRCRSGSTRRPVHRESCKSVLLRIVSLTPSSRRPPSSSPHSPPPPRKTRSATTLSTAASPRLTSARSSSSPRARARSSTFRAGRRPSLRPSGAPSGSRSRGRRPRCSGAAVGRRRARREERARRLSRRSEACGGLAVLLL